jgi:SAM-dependent methyltransferase
MNRKARRAAKRSGRASPAAANAVGAAAAVVDRGNHHLAAGRLEAALGCYLQAIELEPDCMDAHNNLCAVLLAQGKAEAVSGHAAQIIAVKPDYLPAHATLALARLRAGDPEGGLAAVRRSLHIAETAEAKLLFVLCLRELPSAPSADLQELLVRAVSEPWGRPADLAGPCLRLIMADQTVAAVIARAAEAWPQRLAADALFGTDGFTAVARHRLLHALLENTRISDIALERFLTTARLRLLTATAAGDPVDDDGLIFFCALARQCFINEYIFADSEPERALAERVRAGLVEALRAGMPIAPLRPVAVAAYGPLHGLDDAGALLARAWPAPVDDLLTQQIREPAAERRLAATIPRLTPIADEVSMRVRQQYEENPYPRWIKAAPVGGATSIDARLRGQFPFSRFRNLGRDRIDVLVAGCGTGQQLVEMVPRLTGARVLAVDLSLASLAYAKRQTEALGLRHIAFGQADILRLGALHRSFDVIDCGGVLHHLGDPEAGWRVLVGLLRPQGVMRVALYSALARSHVVAARAFAAARGHGSSADDIRRFRHDVLALPPNDPVRRVAESPDFFALSDCRDLVFHVEEHLFSLPRIATFLAANGLQLLGFEADPAALGRYRARFPHDTAATDLTNWHALEQEHPAMFGGMYQFWVQRGDRPT